MKSEIELKEARREFPAFPVTLVTVGENIIAIGLIHAFSFTPPMIGIGVHPKRYSYQLLEEVGDFGVNIPTVDLAEKVDLCGNISGRSVNKFKKFGLTPMKSNNIKSVLIEEFPVNMECKVVKKLSFGGSHDWFIGEVVAAYKEENYHRENALSYWNKEYRGMGELILQR
ncbi:MAG: flavin reductase family protein [Thermoplasmata archaeon]|nr:MAG: flavin reductase family protein [Thermoplasmata archaeon]